MADLRRAATFAAGLYGNRLGYAYHGYLRRDPMSLLHLRPGRDNPYAIYRGMPRFGPTRIGNWVTTSHHLCNAVLRDRRFGVRASDLTAPKGATDEFDMSFLDKDPPDHTRLRRLAQPAFSPKQMAGYRPRIEATVDRLLDRAAATGEFDLVSGYAAPLPIAVITDLLGIPDADAADFSRYGATLGSAIDGIRSLSHARALLAANHELEALFHNLFALRRREPSDDLVSHVVAAEGDRLS